MPSLPSGSTILNLIHFNDVYRVTPQKLPGTTATIDVTQFSALLDSLRDDWKPEKNNGLVLFSGDLFSPSVESTVTRGSHMVPVINEIKPDVALTGNHDFDFGYHHLFKLIQGCRFPWILSNIFDSETGKTPEGLTRFEIFERSGLRIGVIGLVEREWIATVSNWPSNFKYQPMDEVGVELSKQLRDAEGEHKCDLVLALTHARIPNDITLAKVLGAVSEGKSAHQHGVDMIFGGHDHMYYIGRGIKAWEGYDFSHTELGAEEDEGYLIVKSGTDFRDLSSMEVEVVDAPEGSTRRKIVNSVKGKHHVITPDLPSSQPMKQLLSTLLADVSESLKAPVCRTLTEFNCKSSDVRTEESASGNWFADVLRHTYDDALCVKGLGGADAVLICGGTIRGDSVYGPGYITLGDIMEILPFEDPIVVISIDGATLWKALESALGTWPAQEGRFPIVSGFRVEWDSRLRPGQRVVGIWEEEVEADTGNDSDSESISIASGASTPTAKTRPVKGALVSKEPGGKTYTLVTREYMATGHDGYEALKDCPYVGGIDDEHGQIMSSIVRKYLLGLQYVNAMKAAAQDKWRVDFYQGNPPPLTPTTSQRARDRWHNATSKVIKRIQRHHNPGAIGRALKAAETEQMSIVDCFDGAKARAGGGDENCTSEKLFDAAAIEEDDDALVIVAPMVDGRLLNLAMEVKTKQ